MQVNFKPKETYADTVSEKVASARSQRAAVQAGRDKDILDTVSLSGKTPKKPGEIKASVDRVSLSTKMPVDDVNRLLTGQHTSAIEIARFGEP